MEFINDENWIGWLPGGTILRALHNARKEAAVNDDHKADARRSPRGLDGRVALVTASISGVGLGIASALAEAGATVVLNGLGDAPEIDNLCQVLAARHGVAVRFEPADMADPAAIGSMIGRIERSFGPIDILVNNAGIQHFEPIETFPPATWDAIIAINLSAVFHATRAVLPTMKRKSWGRIINVASAHGLIGSAFKGAYVAAQHGVVGFTKVVGLETAEYGITCNAICHGSVWTPSVEQQVAAEAEAQRLPPERVVREILLREQPTRKFATVREIAGTAVFLCGPAAGSITGTTIAVDGGWTAQ